MRKFLLLFFAVVCVQISSWAGASLDHGTKVLTISTDGDASLANTSLGADLYQNTAKVKVVGVINQAGLNKIETSFKSFNDPSTSWVVNNRQNNGVSSTDLDLSDATFDGAITALPEMYQAKGCILPKDMNTNAFPADTGNYEYVVSNPSDRTNGTLNVWVEDGVMPGEVGMTQTDLTNYQNGTLTVNVIGPGAQDFQDALDEGDLGGGDVTQETYIIEVTGSGQLAQMIADANANGNYTNLVIKGGPLNESDMKALANVTCAPNVIMNEASITDDVKKMEGALGTNKKIKHLVLPKGLEEVKEEWFSNYSKLACALSYSNDYDNNGSASIKIYQKKAGNVQSTLNLLNVNGTQNDLGANEGGGYKRNKVKEVIIAGNANAKDLEGGSGAGVFFGSPIEHFDLSKVHLSENNDILAVGNGLDVLNTPTTDQGYRNWLKQIEIPSDLSAIPAYCFYDFEQLSGEMFIPNTIHSIGEKAFYKCTSLTQVEFEENMPQDFVCGDYAFSECWGIKHIVLPEGLTVVSTGMFQRCYNLESIRLPNTLTRIEESAFEQADALSYLTIPEKVEYIGPKAFFNSGVKDLYLMAPTPDKLPVIYSIGNGGENQGVSSFGGDNVEGYNNFPDVDEYFDYLKKLVDRGLVEIDAADQEDFNAANGGNIDEKNINRWLKYLTSDQMEEVYRLHAAATERPITAIHYADTPAMNEFFHHNPWKGNEDFCNALDMGAYSDGGSTMQSEKNRYLNADYLTEAYGLGPDKYGKWWPTYNHRDYDLRVQWGYPGNAINANDQYNSENKQDPSRLGWRQFVLSFGYSPNNDDEVYSKKYDDTWYTMCFPFDLSDEQLEGAFNSYFNICEFNGVAMVETPTQKIDPNTGEVYKDDQGEVVKEKNLILLFTNIAKTYYRDKYGNFYDRVKIDKEVEKEGSTVIVSEKWYHPVVGTPDGKGGYDMTYTYTTNQYVPSGTSYNGTDGWFTYENAKTNGSLDVYESIRGVLAQAGHPYMIHPQKVEDANGGATKCVLNHIQYKFEYSKLKKLYEANPNDETARQNYENALAELTSLYDTEKVTRKLSKVKEGTVAEGEEGNYDVVNLKSGKVYLETIDEGVTYTFKGSFEADKTVAIPYRSYFLAVKDHPKYPKYYREMSKNPNLDKAYWGQYSAVIEPNDGALAWEDANIEVNSSSVSGAKSVSMGFGDFEVVTADEIKEIVADAKEKKLPVQFMNVVLSINGQIVREGVDMTGLPKGVYIVNGKKYMVK